MGNLSLLQGIFPPQGSKRGLLHGRWILSQLSHQRSPRILEWVAYPFSSGSSQPRNQTSVSCISGKYFTSWATREAHLYEDNDERKWYKPQKKKKREKGYLLIVAKRMLFSSSGLMNYIEEENNSVQGSRAKEVY